MNTFSIVAIIIFMVIVFILLLILVAILFFIGKRSSVSNKSELGDKHGVTDEEELLPKSAWEKINSTLSKAFSPELEMGTNESPRYKKVSHLFTIPEREFYEFLCESVGDKYRVFAKVRMADVMYLENEPVDKKYFRNHIRCRHFDFVLCEPLQQRPVIAIELDDSSHQRYDRKASDDFKNMACQTAKFPLLRIKLPYKYSKDEFLHLIQTRVENAYNV
jgi:Na+-transporting methylmalonyl-CoA/oxaloacetate decarboxylase gamma subunit